MNPNVVLIFTVSDEVKFYILFDVGLAILFYTVGIYFYKSNGKAANFISGYNMKSDEERKQFDEIQLCKIYGKRMMYWAVPFMAGAIMDLFINGIGCATAWGIWIVMFIYHMIDRNKREKSK
ncbi:protein of unknown function [Anaerosporobacter mobilis DSM 15930]|jgi:hypothetical protein|uniref:DUF3784 domain-containing protein n=2 Tax=Anaerosporobacter TaxID=653683 RepID=A0A1M7NAU9_9FIRM|nr:protein of unknown function [Anaerosporobacter mobilis DSM 15930]